MYSIVYTNEMAKNISIKDLRPGLPKVMELVERQMERFVITKHGKPVGVILSPQDYEGLLETIDILEDKKLVKRLERAEADVKAGRTTSLEEIHRSLGLV